MSDYIIDIGPDGGTKGGKITFIGTVFDMFENSNCITAEFLRNSLQKIT
jgi:excinuclease ABC subunit A